MLKDFYTIQSESINASAAEFSVALNPDCEVYKGHFPGEPVSPGVCSIQMIKECAERVAGYKLSFVEIRQCRFLQLLSPATTPCLNIYLELKPKAEDCISLDAKIQNADVVCVSLSGTLKSAE